MRYLPFAILIAVVPAALAEPPPTAPPPTARRAVDERLHGLSVHEDYRWLEAEQAPEVKAWIDAETRYARAWLDATGGRDAIAERVRAIELYQAPSFSVVRWRGGRWFLRKRQPPRQQPWVVTRAALDDAASERVVLDPNQVDPSGGTSIDWFVPSVDGKRIAVSMSKHGSERSSLYLFDVATGKQLPDVVPRVQVVGGGGSATFNADGSGVYYTRYPREGERPAADLDFYAQVWFHKIGTPIEQDKYVMGKELPRIAEIHLETSEDGRYILARVANGDGGEAAFYLGQPDGAWTTVARDQDHIYQALLGSDGGLYLWSRDRAPRGKILRVALDQPRLDAAKVVAAEDDAAIASFVVTDKHLFVSEIDGGPSRVRVLTLDGKPVAAPSLLPLPAVDRMVRGAGDELVFWQENDVTPGAYWRWSGGELSKTSLVFPTNVGMSDCEVVRRFATSKDGTKVPYTIVRKKGLPADGNNPTVLTGYGGYGINQPPGFRPGLRVLIEQGGVFVLANLRGGGEYGDAWHQAGRLMHKQNVFDDFIAVSKALIADRITRPERFAIVGGSNGGLLMGAAITQHPELYRATVISRGVLDMAHFDRIANGVYNSTEFGSPAIAEQLKTMLAYSPLHHVVDGTKYPSVLLMTGTNDGRVAPSDSYKMTARLQAATKGGVVLLRASDQSGHGMGTKLDERIAEIVDYWCFIFRELGVNYAPVKTQASR